MTNGNLSPVTRFLRRIAPAEADSRLSDVDLLLRFVTDRGDQAFAALVRRHGPMVWAVCRRVLGNEHDAEDAFQATFLVLLRRAGSLCRPEFLGAWLHGVAYRTALRVRDQSRSCQTLDSLPEGLLAADPLPELAWRELQLVLDEELARLPLEYRAPFVLCYLEGKTYLQAARQLGWPTGTLSKRLARARELMRVRLARRGLGISAGLLGTVLQQHASAGAVPSALMNSTIEAATRVAAGGAATSAVSTRVAALTRGVLKAMLLTKLGKFSALVLVVVCLGAGAAALVSRAVEAGPPSSGPGFERKKADKPETKPRPSAEPSRADRLKAIKEAYTKARDEYGKAVGAGTIKPDADGKYPGWAEVVERHARLARKLLDEDPADAVACDALVFCIADLGTGGYAADPALYRIAREHHAASEKLEPVLGSAPPDLLRAVAARSPHANIRLWANYHLAEKLYAAGKAKEAEPLLEAVGRDEQARKLGGFVMGSLADTANRLLFEVRRLNVGQEVPEIAGTDLDGKPMKLSEFRGKVTLLVFWATWCVPCLEMVPHERALAERYAGKPFVIVGVNGDTLPDKTFEVKTVDGKVIDHTARVKAALEKHKISWRSFRNGQYGVGLEWNVRAWPTIFLIDHRGIIRGKWKGDPGEALDTAIADLVRRAETMKDTKDR
jgi:RNA polymerase sigma factor (sigma-70 family)